MRVRPFKRYIAAVIDAEGVTYQYVFTATSRRRAKREAREWVTRTEWGATLVGITPVLDQGLAKGLRLLVVAGFTLVVSGTTITAMMIIGLSLEGAL